MPAAKTQSAPSLDRALTILELVACSRAGRTLRELVQESGLPRSSVHYLLVTLERRGYLQKNLKTSRYLIGMTLAGLAGNPASCALSLAQQASTQLRDLARRTRLTVHMGILQHGEAVLIAKHEPPEGTAIATWVGKRMDVHCTGLGKALIAHISSVHLDRILLEHGLPKHNENTISSPRRLREELAEVARLGYALDDEEDEIGLRCVGAPVLGEGGQTIAAISVAGQFSITDSSHLGRLTQEIRYTAGSIARAIAGASPARPSPQH